MQKVFSLFKDGREILTSNPLPIHISEDEAIHSLIGEMVKEMVEKESGKQVVAMMLRIDEETIEHFRAEFELLEFFIPGSYKELN